MRALIEGMRIQSKDENVELQATVDIMESMLEAYENQNSLSVKEIIEGARLGAQVAQQVSRDRGGAED
jgi:subtilase family serine protease